METERPRFVADAMLGRLARWLRTLGYDTACDDAIPDAELVRRAFEEGRHILTGDRRLFDEWRIEGGLVIYAEKPLEQLSEVVELASEGEFSDRFPNCEIGAMPPFGNLWGLTVFVDEHLREDEQIAFNAGSHTELVKLSYADYERMLDPVVARLSTRA